jgi:hypothetical protein
MNYRDTDVERNASRSRATALAERVFAGNKNMTVLLEAELEKAMNQAREIRKQTEAGIGDGSQLDFQMGIVSGLRSALSLAQVGSGDAMRSELIKVAAALARFQHVELSEIEQQDLPLFGDYARRLKKVADSI